MLQINIGFMLTGWGRGLATLINFGGGLLLAAVAFFFDAAFLANDLSICAFNKSRATPLIFFCCFDEAESAFAEEFNFLFLENKH